VLTPPTAAAGDHQVDRESSVVEARSHPRD
jgi:hypothetical protein